MEYFFESIGFVTVIFVISIAIGSHIYLHEQVESLQKQINSLRDTVNHNANVNNDNFKWTKDEIKKLKRKK